MRHSQDKPHGIQKVAMDIERHTIELQQRHEEMAIELHQYKALTHSLELILFGDCQGRSRDELESMAARAITAFRAQ